MECYHFEDMEKTNINSVFHVFRNGLAHRGLFSSTIPENSKAAFLNAINYGLPFETDIHMTKDKRIVVCHDSELSRLTNKKGIIEDLSFDDIQKNYRLGNGESLLSREELLSVFKESKAMVLELKTYNGNASSFRDALIPFLNEIKDRSKIVIISFYAELLSLIKDRGFNCGLLVGQKQVNNDLHLDKWDFLDADFHFLDDPRFISYRKAGKKILAWTIRTKEELDRVTPYCDGVTFESLDPSSLVGQFM